MSQPFSSEVVMKNTAEAVMVPLKDGISSLNKVYEALIDADVDPVIGKCSNSDYIRELIVQAQQHLQCSEQVASSGLKSLDENLERLIQDEGKLQREVNDTKQTLDDLRTKQESNENLLRNSQGALELARTNVNSTKRTLQEQQRRARDAERVRDVGLGLLAIPIIGWIAGTGMIIGGSVEMEQAAHAVRVAEEEVRRSDNEVNKYEQKVSYYKSRISQTRDDISQKEYMLKQMHERIQQVKKQIESVADFQKKMRSAVHVLGLLSGRVSVAEKQTRHLILKEPVMKVMEDVKKATEEFIGNKLL